MSGLIYSRFGFLRVSPLLFKPQVKGFFRGQLQATLQSSLF